MQPKPALASHVSAPLELLAASDVVADPAACDSKVGGGETALHFAAASGNALVVALLLAAGADPNARENTERLTPLHMACRAAHPRCVALLVAAGARCAVKSSFGKNPLHYALSSSLARMQWEEVRASRRR